MKIKLEGKRVILRPFVMEDAPSIAKHIHDKDIYEVTLTIPFPYKESDAEWFIKKSQKDIEEKKAYALGIVLKETNEVIGCIEAGSIDHTHEKSEVGYWLSKQHWGKGIMPEALDLLIDFAFNGLKLHRLYAFTFVENTASQKVLEKCGFTKEGRKKDACKKDGQYKDDFVFGLVVTDYHKK